MKRTRMILIALAVGFILIPGIIVSITGNGFGNMASRTLVSLSVSSLIGGIMLGADRADKHKFYTKIGITIGLLIVLLSLWI